MPLTTHSIGGWPPVDADSCQSTHFGIHLQTGTADILVVHVAHVVVAGLLKILVWDNVKAVLKDPLKDIQVRVTIRKPEKSCPFVLLNTFSS